MAVLSDQSQEAKSGVDVATEPTTQELPPPQANPAEQLAAAMTDLRACFAEMVDYALYLLALQVDRGKLLAKQIGFYAIAGILGLVVLAAFIAVGTCLLLIGAAGLLGQLFNNFWIGATIVGVLMFVLPALGGYLAWGYLNEKAYKALRAKYEARRQHQRESLGRDVKEVAGAQ